MSGPLFLSTYPPRQCGIATFTHDVVRSVQPFWADSDVIAVDDRVQSCLYPRRVIARLEQFERPSYPAIAAFVNNHTSDVLNIQHEFGIFGGANGSWLLDLVERVLKPVVITLHTVLPNPSREHVRLVRELHDLSTRLIVLSETARTLLEERYGIASDDVMMIPHGIPDVPYESTNRAKAAVGLRGRFIVTTFGLLSRGKGLENAIDAIGRVARKYPEVLYVILGATHPVVRRTEGESYREELRGRIEAANLTNNVMAIDRYFALEDLLEFLAATDIYVTPYINEAQVVSGTLAYALGAGKAVVSTPYLYARELLADRRGVIVPFANSAALAESIEALIDDSSMREDIASRAYAFGRRMRWCEVGRQYAELFAHLSGERYETQV